MIDVDALMADLRRRVAEKKARGLYTVDALVVDAAETVEPWRQEDLERLRALSVLRVDLTGTASTKPVIGGLVGWFKRRLARSTSGPLYGLAAQENAFHAPLLAYLSQLAREVTELGHRVEHAQDATGQVQRALGDGEVERQRELGQVAGRVEEVVDRLEALAGRLEEAERQMAGWHEAALPERVARLEVPDPAVAAGAHGRRAAPGAPGDLARLRREAAEPDDPAPLGRARRGASRGDGPVLHLGAGLGRALPAPGAGRARSRGATARWPRRRRARGAPWPTPIRWPSWPRPRPGSPARHPGQRPGRAPRRRRPRRAGRGGRPGAGPRRARRRRGAQPGRPLGRWARRSGGTRTGGGRCTRTRSGSPSRPRGSRWWRFVSSAGRTRGPRRPRPRRDPDPRPCGAPSSG